MVNVLISIIISSAVCHLYLSVYEKQNDKLLKEFLQKLEDKTILIVRNYLQGKL